MRKQGALEANCLVKRVFGEQGECWPAGCWGDFFESVLGRTDHDMKRGTGADVFGPCAEQIDDSFLSSKASDLSRQGLKRLPHLAVSGEEVLLHCGFDAF